jgi:hypothetical protein
VFIVNETTPEKYARKWKIKTVITITKGTIKTIRWLHMVWKKTWIRIRKTQKLNEKTLKRTENVGKEYCWPEAVTQACNPSYLRGRHLEGYNSRTAWAKSF